MYFFKEYDKEFESLQTKTKELNPHKNINNISEELQKILKENNLSLKAAFYMWKHRYKDVPVCENCGVRVDFEGKRFKVFCCEECRKALRKNAAKKMAETNFKKYGHVCSLHNKEVNQKTKSTLQKNYGVDSPAKSKEILNKMKASCIEKYGVDNPMKSDAIKEKVANTNIKRYGNKCSLVCEESILKKKQTMLERYGSETYNNMKKYKETCLQKYGVTSTRKLKENEEKRKETLQESIEKFKDENNVIECSELSKEYQGSWLYNVVEPIKYKNINFIKIQDLHKIKEYCEINRCSGKSHQEKEVVNFIKEIYNGEVIENNRKIIYLKELDIYVPDKKVAIEYNGLFWHSNYVSDEKIAKERHLHKTKECEKLGIRLLHIFEDEWINKQDIMRSMIASALGVYNETYMARKCVIDKMTYQEAKKFFNENHIQEHSSASYFLCLKYQNEIVQAISIGKNRFTKQKGLELVRMASKLNTQVVGGFSKFVKYALKDLNISSIDSYVDRRLFNASGYESSGWQKTGESKPRYFYTDFNERMNRLMFTKQQCLKMWPDSNSSFTEFELCEQHNLYRVYDCGTIKYNYTN